MSFARSVDGHPHGTWLGEQIDPLIRFVAHPDAMQKLLSDHCPQRSRVNLDAVARFLARQSSRFGAFVARGS